MKVLIKKDSYVAIFAAEDTAEVVLDTKKIIIDETYISDRSIHDTYLVTDIVLPEGWEPHKYKYIDNTWELCPIRVATETEEPV